MDCSCGTNHLDKPFEPRELVERVGKILAGDRTGKDPAFRRSEIDPGTVDLV